MNIYVYNACFSVHTLYNIANDIVYNIYNYINIDILVTIHIILCLLSSIICIYVHWFCQIEVKKSLLQGKIKSMRLLLFLI